MSCSTPPICSTSRSGTCRSASGCAASSAACLLHDPEILFLDEPTIGLDLVAKQRFRELLVRLNEHQGTTIFLTSHDVADIEHVAKRAIVINHGEVIYDDEVAAMRRTLLATKIVEVGLLAPIAAPTPAGVTLLEHTDTVMRLVVDTHTTPIRTVLDELLDGPAVADISVVDPPLEQVIAEIYEQPAPMTRRGYAEAFRGSAHRSIIDGGGLVVAVGFYLVIVGTLSGLWHVAVDANGGDIGGYSALALTWYVITSEAAIVSVNARHIEDIGTDIAVGTVAVELLRPASVLGVRVSTQVGGGVPRVATLWASGAVLATLVAGAPPSRSALLLAAPSLVLAITANLLAQHAVAAIAFWIRDAGSVWFLYMKGVFILGGMIIPLELLPEWLERISLLLALRGDGLRPGPPRVRPLGAGRSSSPSSSGSACSPWWRPPCSGPASAVCRWWADERAPRRRRATRSPRWRPSRRRWPPR